MVFKKKFSHLSGPSHFSDNCSFSKFALSQRLVMQNGEIPSDVYIQKEKLESFDATPAEWRAYFIEGIVKKLEDKDLQRGKRLTPQGVATEIMNGETDVDVYLTDTVKVKMTYAAIEGIRGAYGLANEEFKDSPLEKAITALLTSNDTSNGGRITALDIVVNSNENNPLHIALLNLLGEELAEDGRTSTAVDILKSFGGDIPLKYDTLKKQVEDKRKAQERTTKVGAAQEVSMEDQAKLDAAKEAERKRAQEAASAGTARALGDDEAKSSKTARSQEETRTQRQEGINPEKKTEGSSKLKNKYESEDTYENLKELTTAITRANGKIEDFYFAKLNGKWGAWKISDAKRELDKKTADDRRKTISIYGANANEAKYNAELLGLADVDKVTARESSTAIGNNPKEWYVTFPSTITQLDAKEQHASQIAKHSEIAGILGDQSKVAKTETKSEAPTTTQNSPAIPVESKDTRTIAEKISGDLAKLTSDLEHLAANTSVATTNRDKQMYIENNKWETTITIADLVTTKPLGLKDARQITSDTAYTPILARYLHTHNSNYSVENYQEWIDAEFSWLDTRINDLRRYAAAHYVFEQFKKENSGKSTSSLRNIQGDQSSEVARIIKTLGLDKSLHPFEIQQVSSILGVNDGFLQAYVNKLIDSTSEKEVTKRDEKQVAEDARRLAEAKAEQDRQIAERKQREADQEASLQKAREAEQASAQANTQNTTAAPIAEATTTEAIAPAPESAKEVTLDSIDGNLGAKLILGATHNKDRKYAQCISTLEPIFRNATLIQQFNSLTDDTDYNTVRHALNSLIESYRFLPVETATDLRTKYEAIQNTYGFVEKMTKFSSSINLLKKDKDSFETMVSALTEVKNFKQHFYNFSKGLNQLESNQVKIAHNLQTASAKKNTSVELIVPEGTYDFGGADISFSGNTLSIGNLTLTTTGNTTKYIKIGGIPYEFKINSTNGTIRTVQYKKTSDTEFQTLYAGATLTLEGKRMTKAELIATGNDGMTIDMSVVMNGLKYPTVTEFIPEDERVAEVVTEEKVAQQPAQPEPEVAPAQPSATTAAPKEKKQKTKVASDPAPKAAPAPAPKAIPTPAKEVAKADTTPIPEKAPDTQEAIYLAQQEKILTELEKMSKDNFALLTLFEIAKLSPSIKKIQNGNYILRPNELIAHIDSTYAQAITTSDISTEVKAQHRELFKKSSQVITFIRETANAQKAELDFIIARRADITNENVYPDIYAYCKDIPATLDPASRTAFIDEYLKENDDSIGHYIEEERQKVFSSITNTMINDAIDARLDPNLNNAQKKNVLRNETLATELQIPLLETLRPLVSDYLFIKPEEIWRESKHIALFLTPRIQKLINERINSLEPEKRGKEIKIETLISETEAIFKDEANIKLDALALITKLQEQHKNTKNESINLDLSTAPSQAEEYERFQELAKIALKAKIEAIKREDFTVKEGETVKSSWMDIIHQYGLRSYAAPLFITNRKPVDTKDETDVAIAELMTEAVRHLTTKYLENGINNDEPEFRAQFAYLDDSDNVHYDAPALYQAIAGRPEYAYTTHLLYEFDCKITIVVDESAREEDKKYLQNRDATQPSPFIDTTPLLASVKLPDQVLEGHVTSYVERAVNQNPTITRDALLVDLETKFPLNPEMLDPSHAIYTEILEKALETKSQFVRNETDFKAAESTYHLIEYSPEAGLKTALTDFAKEWANLNPTPPFEQFAAKLKEKFPNLNPHSKFVAEHAVSHIRQAVTDRKNAEILKIDKTPLRKNAWKEKKRTEINENYTFLDTYTNNPDAIDQTSHDELMKVAVQIASNNVREKATDVSNTLSALRDFDTDPREDFDLNNLGQIGIYKAYQARKKFINDDGSYDAQKFFTYMVLADTFIPANMRADVAISLLDIVQKTTIQTALDSVRNDHQKTLDGICRKLERAEGFMKEWIDTNYAFNVEAFLSSVGLSTTNLIESELQDLALALPIAYSRDIEALRSPKQKEINDIVNLAENSSFVIEWAKSRKNPTQKFDRNVQAAMTSNESGEYEEQWNTLAHEFIKYAQNTKNIHESKNTDFQPSDIVIILSNLEAVSLVTEIDNAADQLEEYTKALAQPLAEALATAINTQELKFNHDTEKIKTKNDVILGLHKGEIPEAELWTEIFPSRLQAPAQQTYFTHFISTIIQKTTTEYFEYYEDLNDVITMINFAVGYNIVLEEAQRTQLEKEFAMKKSASTTTATATSDATVESTTRGAPSTVTEEASTADKESAVTGETPEASEAQPESIQFSEKARTILNNIQSYLSETSTSEDIRFVINAILEDFKKEFNLDTNTNIFDPTITISNQIEGAVGLRHLNATQFLINVLTGKPAEMVNEITSTVNLEAYQRSDKFIYEETFKNFDNNYSYTHPTETTADGKTKKIATPESNLNFTSTVTTLVHSFANDPSVLPQFRKVFSQLETEREQNADPLAIDAITLAEYIMLHVLELQEITINPELTVEEKIVDEEQKRETAMLSQQGALLDQIYSHETLQHDSLEALQKRIVDFSNLQYLSPEIYTEKFRYFIRGGHFLTGNEAQGVLPSALSLLHASKEGRDDRLTIGDLALHTFYKDNPNTFGDTLLPQFPTLDSVSASTRFFTEFTELNTLVSLYGSHAHGTEISKSLTNAIEAVILRFGKNKIGRDTLRAELVNNLRDGKPIPQIYTSKLRQYENFLITSRKILDVIDLVNESIALEKLDADKDTYTKKYPKLDTHLSKGHVATIRLLETQWSIYEEWKREEKGGTPPQISETQKMWMQEWLEKSFIPSLELLTGNFKVDKNFISKVQAGTAESYPSNITTIIQNYHDAKPTLTEIARSEMNPIEGARFRRLNAIPDYIISNPELNNPKNFEDLRCNFTTLDTFDNLDKAYGPYDEDKIAYNHPLTNIEKSLRPHESIYIDKSTVSNFVQILRDKKLLTPEIRRNLLTNPQEIAKFIYAISGSEYMHRKHAPDFYKKHFKDNVTHLVLSLTKDRLEDLIEEKINIIKTIRMTPESRDSIFEKYGDGDVFTLLHHLTNDRRMIYDSGLTVESSMRGENDASEQLNTFMEYTLRSHEMTTAPKLSERVSKPALMAGEDELYTDPFESYTDRKGAYESYLNQSNKQKYFSELIDFGFHSAELIRNYPEKWDEKYTRLIEEEFMQDAEDALILLKPDNQDSANKYDTAKLSELSSDQLTTLATLIQLGKIFENGLRLGRARKEMVFKIFESYRGEGKTNIADILRAQDKMFTSLGKTLTPEELFVLGKDIENKLHEGSITRITMSAEAYALEGEYVNFRNLLANTPTDEAEKATWLANLNTSFDKRLSEFFGELIGMEDADQLKILVDSYCTIQLLKNLKKSNTDLEKQSDFDRAITALTEKYATQTPNPLTLLEDLLVHDFTSLLAYTALDMEKSRAKEVFAGLGMDINLDDARSLKGNISIGVRPNENVSLRAVVFGGPNSLGTGVGMQVTGDMDAKYQTPTLYLHANADAVRRTIGGTIGFSVEKVQNDNSSGSFGLFVTGELGENSASIVGGFEASVSPLAAPETVYKILLEKLSKERADTYKRETAHIEEIIDNDVSIEDASKSSIKKATIEALSELYLESIPAMEAGTASTPKQIQFAGLRFGVSAGLSTTGIPVQGFVAIVFNVDGVVRVRRITDSEHLMDESSDRAIMQMIREGNMRASDIQLDAPVTSDFNPFSADRARQVLERNAFIADRLHVYLASKGADKVRDENGQIALAAGTTSELTTGLKTYEDFQKEKAQKFNGYLQKYNTDIAEAQVHFESLENSYRARMVLDKCPGMNEIHIDPSAEKLVSVGDDGNLIFDFAGGFPIISKETFEYSAPNYGAITLNIFTIRFNRNLPREDVEKMETGYYFVEQNDDDMKARTVKLTPFRPIEIDTSIIERAVGRGAKAFEDEYRLLETTMNEVKRQHQLFIDENESAFIIEPGSLKPDIRTKLRNSVNAFVPKEGATDKKSQARRLIIERLFTISTEARYNESLTGKAAQELLDDTDLGDMRDAFTETEEFIKEIQAWYAGENNGTKMTAEELQYFLGELIFRTFYNIHRNTYSYTGEENEFFITKPEMEKSAQTRNNPVVKTLSSYLAHLQGSAKDMAIGIATNYVERHPDAIQNKDTLVSELTNSLLEPVYGRMVELMKNAFFNTDKTQSEKFCKYLIYLNWKGKPAEKFYTKDLRLTFTQDEVKKFNALLTGKTNLQKLHDIYATIFDESRQTPESKELGNLHPAFASARHYDRNLTEEGVAKYVAGGRALEAISLDFLGIRDAQVFSLSKPKQPGESQEAYEARRTRALMIMEYMSPIDEISTSDNQKFDPMNVEQYMTTQSEIGTREVNADIESTMKEISEKLTPTYEDAKLIFSNALGMQLVGWAGLYMSNEEPSFNATNIIKLFNRVRLPHSDTGALNPSETVAFKEYLNTVMVMRQISSFIPSEDKKSFSFYGLEGIRYDVEFRYVPVQNIQAEDENLTTEVGSITTAADQLQRTDNPATETPTGDMTLVPMAYIFASNKPNNAMLVNCTALASLITFGKCGNWSTGFKEAIYNYYLKPKDVEYSPATRGVRELTRDTVRPHTEPKHKTTIFGVAFGGELRSSTIPTLPEPTGSKKVSQNAPSQEGTDDNTDPEDLIDPTLDENGVQRLPGDTVTRLVDSAVGLSTGGDPRGARAEGNDLTPKKSAKQKKKKAQSDDTSK